MHVVISDASIGRHRYADVNPSWEPMTVEAIRHSPPTQPEYPTQEGVIDLETHMSPPM